MQAGRRGTTRRAPSAPRGPPLARHPVGRSRASSALRHHSHSPWCMSPERGRKMDEPPARAGGSTACLQAGGGSDHSNVLSLVALPARSDVELHGLAFVEGLVTLALDVREVHEHVVAVFTRDEAEALFRVEELHSACSQLSLSSVYEPIRATSSGNNVPDPRARYL